MPRRRQVLEINTRRHRVPSAAAKPVALHTLFENMQLSGFINGVT
jgi:hypothetical protein